MAAYVQFQRGSIQQKAERVATLKQIVASMEVDGTSTKRQIGAARGNVTRAIQGLFEAIQSEIIKENPLPAKYPERHAEWLKVLKRASEEGNRLIAEAESGK